MQTRLIIILQINIIFKVLINNKFKFNKKIKNSFNVKKEVNHVMELIVIFFFLKKKNI